MTSGWLFALIPFGLGVIFFAIGYHGIRRARTLRRTGAKAEGQIVRLNTSSANKGGTVYHPVARWLTPDGQAHEHSARMGKSIILNFRPGTPVLIHYDPANPRRAAIDGYDGGGADWLFTILGALLTVGTAAVVTARLLTQ